MLKKRKEIALLCLVLIFCVFVSVKVFNKTFQDIKYYENQDIYEHWQVSSKILKGENPYLAILSSDMKVNSKYPTYFTGFYYLIAPSIKVIPQFKDWIVLWKYTAIFFYALVGFLIFFNSYKNSNILIGAVLASVWFLNRWSLYLASSLSIDTIPISLLLLSLLLIKTHKRLSVFTFGTQLAIKHLSIFAIPLFLLQTSKMSVKKWIQNLLVLILPVLLVSIKFLTSNPTAYLKSIIFSGTRIAENHFAVVSMHAGDIIKLDWANNRFPMLISITIIYFLFALKKIPFNLSIILVVFISITFNPVFFLQYEPWFIAILLFYFSEFKLNDQSY